MPARQGPPVPASEIREGFLREMTKALNLKVWKRRNLERRQEKDVWGKEGAWVQRGGGLRLPGCRKGP